MPATSTSHFDGTDTFNATVVIQTIKPNTPRPFHVGLVIVNRCDADFVAGSGRPSHRSRHGGVLFVQPRGRPRRDNGANKGVSGRRGDCRRATVARVVERRPSRDEQTRRRWGAWCSPEAMRDHVFEISSAPIDSGRGAGRAHELTTSIDRMPEHRCCSLDPSQTLVRVTMTKFSINGESIRLLGEGS